MFNNPLARNANGQIMNHREFLEKHPELATLEYKKESPITDREEFCFDHPIIRYHSGTVIDGIPETDRIAMFESCQCHKIRCMCPEHHEEFVDGVPVFVEKTKKQLKEEIKYDRMDQHVKSLRAKFEEMEAKKKQQLEDEKKEQALYKNMVKFSQMLNQKWFTDETGKDIRPSDQCITDLMMRPFM